MRAILVWQSAQTLLPTKCAPSIRGGSITLRSSVEQELTNKAVAPASASAAAKAYLAFIGEQSCDSGRRGFLSRRHLTKDGGHFKLQLHSGTKLFASRLTWKRFACDESIRSAQRLALPAGDDVPARSANLVFVRAVRGALCFSG